MPVGRNRGIVIVALRRIKPGEEITYDYGREYLNYFFTNSGCRCAFAATSQLAVGGELDL
jgi:hypothetical protein